MPMSFHAMKARWTSTYNDNEVPFDMAGLDQLHIHSCLQHLNISYNSCFLLFLLYCYTLYIYVTVNNWYHFIPYFKLFGSDFIFIFLTQCTQFSDSFTDIRAASCSWLGSVRTLVEQHIPWCLGKTIGGHMSIVRVTVPSLLYHVLGIPLEIRQFLLLFSPWSFLLCRTRNQFRTMKIRHTILLDRRNVLNVQSLHVPTHACIQEYLCS